MTEAGPQADRMALMQLALGGMAAQVVAAATAMRLADEIGDGERTPAELARAYGTPEQPMHRLLRALAGLGLCAEEVPGRFRLTARGRLLRTDVPGSVHSFVRMFTHPTLQSAWGRLETAVRTGRTVFDDVFGEPFFAHIDRDPELSALFNASMSQATSAVAAAAPAHYDFGRFGTVTDVGGGDGTLLAAILRANPGLRGVVFDSPAGSAKAANTLAEAGLADRGSVATGDFFTAVPEGADLYLLKSIVHDWDDERAATILGHCRAVLPEDGRVLVVEPVLPDAVAPDGPAGVYLSDLTMLVNVGGRERTMAEFERLCERAGLIVTSVTQLPPETGFCLIEAALAY